MAKRIPDVLHLLLAQLKDLEHEDVVDPGSIFTGEQVVSREDVLQIIERGIRQHGN